MMGGGVAGLTLAGAALLLAALPGRRRRYDLVGRTVLITGGSRGLGLVLAREFGRRGARVAICARNEEQVERAAEDLRSRGIEAFAFTCDVTDRDQVESNFQRVRERWGEIDVLVNNAGTIAVGPIETVTTDDYRESLDIHFWGPVYTTMAVLPWMRRRRSGRIVNISSIGGKISVPHLVPYSAGKFALAGFSEGLHAEVKKDGVCVTTVYPGLMRTGSPRNANFKGQHRAEYAWFSVSDALPLFSISAERAARGIVSACESGRARLILSAPAKAAIKANEMFPEIVSALLAITNQLLPSPGGIGTNKARGHESFSAISPSWLTVLDERAARRNNQVA
jgi:NAD(P)-dependent dehydrogenase (short-subunit alcohol dehydrogenase family)